MALNFPSSPSNGDQYTDPNGRIWKFDGTAWEPSRGSGTRLFKGAKVKLTSNEGLTSTSTAITWDSEVYDIGNFYDSGNNTRLTASETGYYRINAIVVTGTGGSGNSYDLSFKKNGSTTIASVSAGPNQSIVFDEVIYLVKGDYVELYGDETTAAGTLTSSTTAEFILVGTAAGSTTYNNATAFSGVKAELTSTEGLTATNTAITWDAVEFNVNADSTGNVYWESGTSNTINFYTSGYYRVKIYIAVSSGGSNDSYNVNLVNSTTMLQYTKLSPNDTLEFDEVLYINTDDYLQVEAAETTAAGSVLADSYILVTRQGV